MEATTKSTSLSNGLIFGIIAGLIYCISLYIRYNFTSTPIMLGVLSLVFYLVVIGTLVFCGISRRKQLGGFIEIKEAFQTIFIAILVAEFIYVLFNFIYLKYIDPGFFERFKISMESFIEGTRLSDDQKEKQLELMEKRLSKQQDFSINSILFSYFISVAITGVFGLIISLIIKKQKQIFDIQG